MFDKLSSVLLYVTIAIAVLTAAFGLFVNFFKKEKLSAYKIFASGIAAGYAFAAGAIMFSAKIITMKEGGEFTPALFYPVLALLLLVLVLIVAGGVIAAVKKSWFKAYTLTAFAISAVYVALLLFLTPLKQYMIMDFKLSEELPLAAFAVGFAAILILLPLFFGKKSEANETKAIVYAALSVALSFALSYVRLFRLPQSGSVTFASLLPLLLYSYVFGIRKGVVAGLVYGLLQAIQDPMILHPVQFLLDYPAAFGMIGLAGIFKEINLFKKSVILQFVAGGIFAAILRYACHVVTGIIVFDIYAEEGFSPVAWGFLYNSFVFADMGICLVAAVFVLASNSVKKILLNVK